ncbi:hypothetical protein BDI4_700065 [Burkholderia diffusa]|nr:hypothetical protein BDI4_700065 [Burkholderia diffusa]
MSNVQPIFEGYTLKPNNSRVQPLTLTITSFEFGAST